MPCGRSRLALARDLAAIVAVFAVCPLAARWAPSDPAGPITAGRAVLALQHELGIAVEVPASRWLAAHGSLSVALSLLYVWVHVPATVGALVWCRLERPRRFGRALQALVLAQAATILTYLAWPVAPPRFVDDAVVDGVAAVMGADVGGLSGVLQSPYAAMPSGHVAFAVLVAAVLAEERRRLPRGAGAAYAALVSVIVILTGNHYVLDVVAGAVVAGAAWWVAGRVRGPVAGPAARAQSTSTKATPSSTSTGNVSTGW